MTDVLVRWRARVAGILALVTLASCAPAPRPDPPRTATFDWFEYFVGSYVGLHARIA